MPTEQQVIACLPPSGFLKDYVYYAANCTDAHAAYHLGTGLVLIAATCPIEYSFPFGMPVWSNLYTLCVGPSGKSRKSASAAVAKDLLLHAVPGAVGETPGSREVLIDNLKSNPRQVLVYSEFGAFLAATESKGYLHAMKTTLTEAYDGTPLGRARVGKTDTEAKTPRLSMICASTLDFLEAHTSPADWTGGFLSRFLTFMGERERTNPLPARNDDLRNRLLAQLALMNFAASPVIVGPCLGFDPSATQRWQEWYYELENAPDASKETAGAVARAHAQALKIALLLAWADGWPRQGDGRPWYVTREELDTAIAITRLHIESVTQIGDRLAPSKDMRDRRAVLDTIKKIPQPLGAVCRGSKLLKRRTSEVLETLQDEGIVELKTAGYVLKPPPEAVHVAAEVDPSADTVAYSANA